MEVKNCYRPRGLDWSQDQDLEDWGRRIWQGGRQPLGTPPADSIGLYCAPQQRQRIFPYEVSILHDLCPIVVPWAFPEEARDHFGKFLTETLPASDLVLSVSRSTKADAAWFSSVDPERIVVAYPGPSLCVESHRHRGRVVRSDRIGLVVSTIEPRKNAAFLFDWFQKTTLLPPDMELWWVGKLGWMISRDELERMANPAGGRRIRFLDSVSDGELCRLYQQASWSIYPSRYEGFGFPILDSLRHGTPVLASCTSSMAEFDHPGIFFFDPQDPATVDSAWQRLEAARPVTIPQAGLDELYNWDLVARTILDAHARSAGAISAGPPRSVRPSLEPERDRRREPTSPPRSRGRRRTARARVKRKAGLRIGIEMFGTQSPSRNRGIGRYTRNFVATLLARDPDNEYVLYCQEGLPTDHIPEAPNAVTRPLRPDPARGETTLAHVMERLAETNPDGLDVLLVCNPLELALGFDLPAKPLNGLKMAAVVYDLIPLIFQEEYFPLAGARVRAPLPPGLDPAAQLRRPAGDLGLVPERLRVLAGPLPRPGRDHRHGQRRPVLRAGPHRHDAGGIAQAPARAGHHAAVRLLRGGHGLPEEPVGPDRRLRDAAGRVAAVASVGAELCPEGEQRARCISTPATAASPISWC